MENKITFEEEQERKGKTYKLLLWFGMISICMIFAGLTSAFVVSKSRPDWLSEIVLPNIFYYGTVTFVISSFTYILALNQIKKGLNKVGMFFLTLTLFLGLTFIVFQFIGFNELYKIGLVVGGPTSEVTISFLGAFALIHLLHLVGGIISLLVVIYNHYKQKYNSTQTLGIELSAMYWHFMDFIWVYLFLFFYFFK
jgi:cytochrome c oxidase subunit 3